jgi:hypothetical protein
MEYDLPRSGGRSHRVLMWPCLMIDYILKVYRKVFFVEGGMPIYL